MKRIFLSFVVICCAMFCANSGFAQTKKPVQKNEEIIIRKNNESDLKTIIVIDSNAVTINGQPLADYKGNVRVIGRGMIRRNTENLSLDRGLNFNTINLNARQAFLGVLTEKSEKGVMIKSVTKESSAEKSGLKEQDIITKVGDKQIATPEDLSEIIRTYQPGDRIKIAYLRNGKKKKTSANLGSKRAMEMAFSLGKNFINGQNFNFKSPDFSSLEDLRGFNFFNNAQPKLGLKIQDTEDGNGVTILNVEPSSAAEKAGLKKDDVITEWSGQKVNSVSEIRERLNSAESKTHYSIKAKRNNNDLDFEVQVPKQLKSADL